MANRIGSERQRRALFAVGAQFWINGTVYASVIPRLPEIRDQVGASKSTLGLALTLASIGGLIGSASSSTLIRKLGSRSVILIGTAVMLVSLPLISFTQSVAALAIVLGVVAFTDVGVDIGMNLQGSWLSANRDVSVMNRLHGLWSLGSVVGGVLAAQATANQISLQIHLVLVAVSLVVLEIGVGFSLLGRRQFPGDGMLGQDESDHHQTDQIASDRPDHSSSADNAQVNANGSVGRNVALVLAALGAAAIAMEMTTTDWASFRLGDDLSIDTTRVGFGFVAFTSGMVVGRFSGDWIESRIGTRVLVRSAAVLAGTGIALASLVPAGWFGPSSHLAVSLLGYFVAALGVSVIFPQLYDAAAKAPGPPGRALGAMTAGSRVATLILPVVVGVLADTQLSVGAAVALVTLPGCVLIFMLRTNTGQPQHNE